MEYKTTLNLPKTNFPMKANLNQLEPRILAHWKQIDIYKSLLAERKDAPQFLLHDGPPYANGSIHIGHALNKILKDIIIKYKAMRGFYTPYIPGWDCHGLPVEHQLFKELNKTKHDVEIVDFRRQAKKFALKYVKLQSAEFEKLGVFGDWAAPYLTLNPEYEYSIMKVLGRLNKEGYIYRGRKPVNWCAACETALAEAEVEYADKESHSIYFIFAVLDAKNKISDIKNTYFLVWTTTPWTLISNVAVAVNPSLKYAIVQVGEKRFILAEDRLSVLKEKLGWDISVVKQGIEGRELEGVILQHPFLNDNTERKVLLGDFVSHEDGSGCVHIAPGHGEEDFSLTRKYKDLPMVMPVNEKGIFDTPEEFKGKNIKDANTAVIETLQAKQALIKAEKIQHSYPHCWRCKNPIIFRATFQWFLKIDHKDLRKLAIEETNKVKWVPGSGKERMTGMLETRPDWCLSRQRLWGVPIPALKCKQCGEVTLDSAVLEKASEIFKQRGSDSWFILDLKEFLPPELTCPKCAAKEFAKEFDILDVWFESGASFEAVVKQNPGLNFPADMYLEGSDQHRGWFQVSLIPSVAIEKRAPFKIILTHGFVVDGEGRKMSKSMGNVIAPQEISKNYGAEILRLWAASSDYSEDVKISDGIIKQLVDIYRKIRNTIRFVMGNINDFDIEKNNFEYKDLCDVDKYMLSKAMLLVEEVNSCYEEFSFYKAGQAIFNFCNLSLSSFYLDILKDRLYTFSPNSQGRRSCQFVLFQILKILLKLSAPILSYTSEEGYLAWDNLKNKKDSIFKTTIDEDYRKDWIDNSVIERWKKIFELRPPVLKEIENQREKAVIGSSLEAEVFLKFNGAPLDFYKNCADALREVFIVSGVTIEEGEPSIRIEKARGQKCLRCWNWKNDIDRDKEFVGVCKRCSDALREVK
jgi:isoleucyl-tRNA synthetase